MNQKSQQEPITLSSSAIAQLKTIMEKDQTTKALRIIVDAGGCYGFQYNFKMESDLQPDDLHFHNAGVVVVVDPISYDFIKGSEVDYVEELIGASFVIKNPKASSSCGCGGSFAV